MTISACPRTPCATGTFLSPMTFPQGDPAPRKQSRILPPPAVLPTRDASGISPEPSAASQWRFGDLTLIRDVRPARQPFPAAQSGARLRRQGCVALLGREADHVSPKLLVSPHAGLALAALEHSAHMPGSAEEWLALFVPREWLQAASATPVRWLETKAGPGALLAGFLRQLAGQSPHFSDDQARSLGTATRALLEACIAPASDHAAAIPPLLSSSTVERARQIVQRHMGSPDFGPQQLGRLLAMSRSKLYRLLGREGGVACFINRERLMQARRDLATHGEPLSVHAVASRVGFRDHSTFSRAFRREFGCSPSNLRDGAQLAGRAQEVPSHGPEPRPGAQM